MKPLFAEAIGTFCLVFLGTGAIVVDHASHGQLGAVGVSLAFGLVVLAMIEALGPISGAHLNPAVTLGFYASGRFGASHVGPYVAAQLTGAVAASALLRGMFGPSALGGTFPSGGPAQAFGMEVVLTAILMLVILGVATGAREEGVMAGVAIGATVALDALVGGSVSGASMNPARSFAPALLSGNFSNHWIYWLAPTLGSLLGAGCYRAISKTSE